MVDDEATRTFLDHRELLFSVVYNILGSVADTEDVLQETWLSWAEADRVRVENVRGYLVRIAVNKALARLAAITRRRETYVGQWLPEPVAADDLPHRTEMSAVSSMAMLVVLETLSPAERAVFVLHEVFGYAHTEIARILDRSPAAVRQLAHRAREHVRARRPRYRVDSRTQREVTERFVAAALGGDLDALLRLLSPDVTLWTDGGGKGPAASLHPVHGADDVARLLVSVAGNVPRAEIRYRAVNGEPSALVFHDGAPFAVLVLDLAADGDRVRGVYSVTNPDKLGHV